MISAISAIRRLFHEDKFTDGLEIKALTICNTLICAFTGFMCILNIATNNILMAVANGIVAIWFFAHIIVYTMRKNEMHLMVSMMIGAYLLMMTYVVTGGVEGFSITWLLLVPPMVQFCWNSHYGLAYSVFIGASMCIYLWTPLSKLGYAYTGTLQMRFPMVYFAVTILTGTMQYQMRNYRREQDKLVQNLEYVSRTKNDFLANMSHEIRTPMNAIVGMCELILRDDINENVRENCFNIQNSSRSLLTIINDILDFSKIEAGRIELVEETFNIASTINDVINMAMTRKGDKDIEIIVKVDPTIPKGLVGDELRIRQVILNLMTNAVKFTQKGCVVMKITQSRHVYGINLNVSIKDTGIGITQENIEKLFTSFQQVDTKKNRSVEGTGLGLAISKKLIAQMGGFINVSSTYGEGSEFKFVIPLRVSNQESFIHVNDAPNVGIAVFLDMEKYNHPDTGKEYADLIHELGKGFNFKFTIFDSLDKLRQSIENGTYSHCFTARDEYLRYEKEFNELADICQLAVVQDRFQEIDLPAHIKKVFKPFYALSFAAVMNNDRFIMDSHGSGNFTTRFVAPDAKILIVDDNAINLKVAAGLMKPYNMKIITAISGAEAIEAVKSKDFDLIFMDHMMPEMDGIETTHIIREMPGKYYQEVPIIALTANAVNGAREMFLEKGFNEFLPKPIETSMLDRLLRSWLPQDVVITTSTKVKKQEPEKVVENNPVSRNNGPIDYSKGLAYAGGDEATYLDVLEVYFTSGPKYKEELENCYKETDWENYTVKIHALKSSSLSIGAVNLSDQAKEMEMAGKAGQYEIIIKQHESAMVLYGQVIAEIEKYLRERGYFSKQETVIEEVELKDISMEECLKITDIMLEACEVFDGDEVLEKINKLSTYKLNGQVVSGYFAEVKNYIDDYEYELALEAIQKAVEKIKEEGR